MRKPIIAGNWKMFKTIEEAVNFVNEVKDQLPSIEKVDSVVCTPFVCLDACVKAQGANLRVGAQNMHFEEQGAFTGEVAPRMLESIGVTYCVIGHSERRAMFNETDESVNKKLHKALEHGITPILCVGELLPQREDGSWKEHIKGQVTADFAGISACDAAKIVIAYEPIWAIGTGKTATPDVADETCGFIRNVVKEIYSEEVSEAIRIQYGGSVKTSNIDELMAKPNIDGALVGGASLVPQDFVTLVKAADK